jgi:hypothetical protein
VAIDLPPPPAPVLVAAAAEAPRRPAWARTLDAAARRVSPELRTRFADGDAVLPPLARADLGLGRASRARLAASALYLIPGGVWPGVARNGAAWLAPWAATLRALGVGRVVAVPLFDGRDPVSAAIEPMVSHFTGHHERHAARVVAADLAARPLGAGGGVWLLGHSYGSKVAFGAGERLMAAGAPVAGAVALETHLVTTGFSLTAAPGLPAVVVAENEDGFWPTAPAGVRYTKILAPGLDHMDFVLRPTKALLRSVVRAIAGEASP